MDKIIYEFMSCVKSDPELKEKFESCKDLKESYDKFKSMLNGCTYDEYKSFFEKMYLENCNELSYKDLEQVAGGISPLGMKILTPVMLMTMFVDTSAKFAFAHGESSEGSTGSSSSVAEGQTENDDNDSNLPKEGTIGNISYKINDDDIEIKGDGRIENATIPDELIAQQKPFKIGAGIRSIRLTKGVIIKNLYELFSLENVDVSESDKYVFENNVLYEKTGKDQERKKVGMLVDGVRYVIGNNAIGVFEDHSIPKNATIPDVLLEEGKPFSIGVNIRSVKLSKGATIEDIKWAYSLKYILVDNLDDYIVDEDALYKNENGVKGEKVCPLRRGIKVVDALPIDTTEDEMNFSLELLKRLPTEGESFEKYRKPLDEKDLKEARTEDGGETINEKEVYNEIRKVVNDIVKKVDDRTPGNIADENGDMTIVGQNKEGQVYSKHYELPRDLRIAKAIYRWVAKNIKYVDIGTEQDAIRVFSKRQGVCRGFADLVTVMMRVADIPCMNVRSIREEDGLDTHAYNAVYINDTIRGKTGWALIDSTWAAPKSDNRDVIQAMDEGTETNLLLLNDKGKVKMKTYFPSFYSEDSTLEEDNRYILKKRVHRISGLNTNYRPGRGSYCEEKVFLEGDLNCYMDGHDGQSYLVLESRDWSKVLEDVEIPQELLKYGMPFSIGRNIKSIKLPKGVTIKSIEEGAWRLKSIDADDSNYIFEGSALYEKKEKGEKGKCVALLPSGTINGIEYEICDDHIKISGDARNPQDINNIPRELLEGGGSKPFSIGKGIRSIKLAKGTTIKSIENALDLKSIDADEYIFEGNTLYRNTAEDQKRERIGMIKKGTIKGVKYEILFNCIRISGDEKNPQDVNNIPKGLLEEDKSKPFRIGEGIRSIKLEKGITIDIEDAQDLESIDAEDSDKYVFESNVLYERTGENQERKKIGMLMDGVKYIIKDDAIYMSGNEKDPQDVTIPDELIEEEKPFVIKSGIRSIKLEKGITVDIEDAQNLESIDAEDSDKYVFESNVLYERTGENQERKKIGMLVDGVKYTIEDDVIRIVGDYRNPKDVTIPDGLLAEEKPFVIEFGIRSVKLPKGATIAYISWSNALEYVLVDNLDNYIVEENKLYEKGENGEKGEMVCSLVKDGKEIKVMSEQSE